LSAATARALFRVTAWHRWHCRSADGLVTSAQQQRAARKIQWTLQDFGRRARNPDAAARPRRPQLRAKSSGTQAPRLQRPPAPVRAGPSERAEVGGLRCAFEDVPLIQTEAKRGGQRFVWQAPRGSAPAPIHLVLPRRRQPYRPAAANSERLRVEVESWRLERFLRGEEDELVFPVHAVAEAVRKWRRSRSGSSCRDTVPQWVVATYMRRHACHTATASPSGHLWTARDGPLDAAQSMVMMGSAWLAEAATRLVEEKVVTECQMRALTGLGTHQAAVFQVLDRVDVRVGGWLARRACASRDTFTTGTAGAGPNLCGMQTLRWAWQRAQQGGCCVDGADLCGQVAWLAEGCEVALRALQFFNSYFGMEPMVFARAETAELAQVAWRVVVEWITLRCAPYSLAANAHFPRGVNAALAELHATVVGALARRSPVVIVETTAGLWARPEVQRRYESVLRVLDGCYAREDVRLSPSVHCSANADRDRVFYCFVSKALAVPSSSL
jgi:hypothetical protein